MDFKLTLCYQNRHGEHEHVLGHMFAPAVLRFFENIDWLKEKIAFEEAALVTFPMIHIENVTTKEIFKTRLNADTNELSFYSTCYIVESRPRLFGALTKKHQYHFMAYDFDLDNIKLALSLFLAGDHEQLQKLYALLGQTINSLASPEYPAPLASTSSGFASHYS